MLRVLEQSHGVGRIAQRYAGREHHLRVERASPDATLMLHPEVPFEDESRRVHMFAREGSTCKRFSGAESASKRGLSGAIRLDEDGRAHDMALRRIATCIFASEPADSSAVPGNATAELLLLAFRSHDCLLGLGI